MSNTKSQQAVEHAATSMKVVGALMLGIPISPVSAFAALLAGCSISVITALRTGDRSAVYMNGAFVIANGLGTARALGFLG